MKVELDIDQAGEVTRYSLMESLNAIARFPIGENDESLTKSLLEVLEYYSTPNQYKNFVQDYEQLKSHLQLDLGV